MTTAKKAPKIDVESIEWSDLKEISLAVLTGKPIRQYFNLAHNADAFKRRFDVDSQASWYGYSRGQLERWLTEGFSTNVISDLSEFNPPIREKRKLRFSEEGDEFHFDLAASGDDNYMSEWTKRDSIPGVSLECEIGFTSSTDSSVVNAYNAWLCKVVYSLESVGVDCEILLNLTCDSDGGGNLFQSNRSEKGQTRIIVKKENEITDFVSFSPMLSPAAVRTFGFAAQAMHTDKRKRPVSTTHGYWDTPRTWEVKWDSEGSKLRISATTMHPYEFPEEKMNQKLTAALREMMRKG